MHFAVEGASSSLMFIAIDFLYENIYRIYMKIDLLLQKHGTALHQTLLKWVHLSIYRDL